jgi:uncharacterized membrane protein
MSSPVGKCGVASELCAKLKPSFAQANALVATRCTKCHSPDGVAGPEHDFTVDATLHGHRSNIAAQINACSMPPPGATALTDTERAVIACWAMGGE